MKKTIAIAGTPLLGAAYGLEELGTKLIDDQLEKAKELVEMHEELYNSHLTKAEREANIQPVRTEPKIQRNEPCPCGSGKKYKKCCG